MFQAVSRASYLSRKLSRPPPNQRRRHVAYGPRCPCLHASAVEGSRAKRPVAKGGPITPCEGRCRRCQQATRTGEIMATRLTYLVLAFGTVGLSALALLWQILSGTGFPNQFFCDSWIALLMVER